MVVRCLRFGSKTWYTLMIFQVMISRGLYAQEAPGAEPQRPPPLPQPELPDLPTVPEATPWLLLVSAGLVIAALAGLVIWLLFFLPKHPTLPSLPNARRKALKSLQELRAKAEKMPPPEVSSHVSQILRTYMLDRFGLPAPRRTTQEIFAPGSKAHGAVSPEFISVVQWCDEVSFMPQPSTVHQALDLIDSAVVRMEVER